MRNGMKFSARAAYATIAPAKSSLRGKKGPPLTLEHVGTLFSFIAKGLGTPFSDDVVVVPATKPGSGVVARRCARCQQYVHD
jgi:hypothetical protein